MKNGSKIYNKKTYIRADLRVDIELQLLCLEWPDIFWLLIDTSVEISVHSLTLTLGMGKIKISINQNLQNKKHMYNYSYSSIIFVKSA